MINIVASDLIEEVFKNKTSSTQLTEEEIGHLYKIGCNSLHANNCERATAIFQILTSLKPANYLYMKGLAGCFQANNDFLNALANYKLAYVLNNDVSNSDCLFYSGVCQYKMASFAFAKTDFEAFLVSGYKNAQMTERTHLYLEAIEKSLSSHITTK